MTIYSEEQAKAILDKAIKFSKADECTAQLTGSTHLTCPTTRS